MRTEVWVKRDYQWRLVLVLPGQLTSDEARSVYGSQWCAITYRGVA